MIKQCNVSITDHKHPAPIGNSCHQSNSLDKKQGMKTLKAIKVIITLTKVSDIV